MSSVVGVSGGGGVATAFAGPVVFTSDPSGGRHPPAQPLQQFVHSPNTYVGEAMAFLPPRLYAPGSQALVGPAAVLATSGVGPVMAGPTSGSVVTAGPPPTVVARPAFLGTDALLATQFSAGAGAPGGGQQFPSPPPTHPPQYPPYQAYAPVQPDGVSSSS